ncbi:formyltransferase family protein [uncultured Paraglaciecola sp.]|uniref:methionyl-tRNA formyltransferase n=1 Tax=uncultured Paraglaciecola sp. TaxID=1765024 RepID=UPI0030DB9B74|tara:strand:+ start:39430 stop:40257 length:828 start_codon:yes stop_codon:yes gene_type:complete
MKIAYFGYDPLSCCLDVFLQQEYEYTVIYTGESSPFSDKVIEFATQNNLNLCFEKPTLAKMQLLVEQGVELFFSAEYPWKIPVPTGLKYAINMHPTLLPEGRGMTPLPHLILKHSHYAGITFHKLENDFDSGDVLLQQAIALENNETFDSLSAKIFQQTPELLRALLSNLDDVYQNSQEQGEGSYWPSISKEQQSLDWQQPTAQLLTRLRAFGSLGTYADIAGQAYIITSAHGKQYQHQYSAGQVLLDNPQQIIVATVDGELCIPKKALLFSAIS